MLVKVGKSRTGQFGCVYITKTLHILDKYLFRARFISFLYNISHNL